ncbi:MAG TPA: MFS transporter [Burkholderiales bacterium]|nr:MFS transporter [Burkholderiales bacterium]
MPASLVALCFGNFIIGTGTLIVPGMLPMLSEGLGVSLPVGGQLISAFAFTVCLSAPLLAGATSRFDRRKLLVSMQLLYVAGHLAAALLSAFLPMLLTRVATSFGAALFTAQAAATAALLVPPEKRGRAIAFVFLGWAISSVIGVSLGAYIAAKVGWRFGFLLVAAGAAIAALGVWRYVPAGLRIQPVDRRMWGAILGNRALLTVVGVTFLMSAPQFVILAYIVPATIAFLHVSPEALGLILAGFGAVGVLGNVLSARFVDRLGAQNVVMAAMLSMLFAHLLWPWSAGSLALFLVVLFFWGLGTFAANSAQQARLAALAPQQASVSVALNSSALYLGQAVGPAIGGLVLARVEGVAAYQALVAVSVPLFLAAIAVSALTRARR